MIDKNRLNSLLFSILGSNELVEQWWDSRNKAFDMMTPNEMLELNSEYVVRYILDKRKESIHNACSRQMASCRSKS